MTLTNIFCTEGGINITLNDDNHLVHECHVGCEQCPYKETDDNKHEEYKPLDFNGLMFDGCVNYEEDFD